MKTMKKVTALLLALMMVLSLAACGGKTDNGGNSDNNGSGGKDQPAAVDMTAQGGAGRPEGKAGRQLRLRSGRG